MKVQGVGVIRLTIVTAAAIYGAMWWYGRDEGLPEDRLGRDPEPAAASQPADAAPEASTAEETEETAETPAQAPEPEPAPVDEAPPETEPAPVQDTQSAETAPPDSDPAAQTEPEAAQNAQDDSAPVASPLVAEEAPALTPWIVTGAARVNLRAGPSTDYGIVGALTQGTRVEEMGEAVGGWRQIRVPATGEEGFMFQTYLAAP